jgi:DNA-directed RNA polymerase specialized sigma24 family protein
LVERSHDRSRHVQNRSLPGTATNRRLYWPKEVAIGLTSFPCICVREDFAIFVPQAGRWFASTHWSMVVAAGQRDSPESEAALATLCQRYWYPLYAYARRRLPHAEDAQDRTQAFFAELLEKGYLRQADRARGRFRSFLLTAFQHFLAKQYEREHAQKRGGGRSFLSLDFDRGERRYHCEPSHDNTAEALFERGWALTLLEQGLVQLRQELAIAGKEHLFDCLKGTLTADAPARPYAELASELGMNPAALKVAVHRLRRRYRELILAEIAQTVTTPEEVEDELRDLFAAVRAKKG